MTTERDEDEERRETEDGREELRVDLGEEQTTEEPEEEGGDEEERAAAPTGKSRADKKRERGRLREDYDRVNRELGEAHGRINQLESLVRQSMQTTRDASRDARQTDDPSQGELEKVYDELDAIAQEANTLGDKMPKERVARLTRRARELDARKHELIAERVHRRNERPVDNTMVLRQSLELQFPDVYANPAARRWAKGYYEQAAADGAEEGPELVRKSLEEARKKYGPRPQPSETERHRTTGVARGGTGGPPAKPTSITLTPGMKRMADAAFKHIPLEKGKADKDQARYKKWANGPGKRVLERQQAARR